MPDGRPALSSAISYKDPRAAIAWLEAALGFELAMLIEDEAGLVVHSEMHFDGGAVMVAGEWSANHASPASLGGKNTQSMHIQIETDIDAHCARASAAGAEVIQAPETQFYGDRVYRCRDPEGHIWTVGQTVKAVSRDEAEAITGLKITGWT